jgi:MFS transporter, SP family, solute carrier family 2 (myo-inositol transporter), member 13
MAEHLLGFAAAGTAVCAGRPLGHRVAAMALPPRRKERAYAALLKSRSPEQAALELEEMEATAHARQTSTGKRVRDSLLRRKYVIPFLLACVILACNTATGINSIIGYNTGILLQSGLSDLASHWGYVIFTVVNFLATTIGMTLVDRKGADS